MKKIYLIVFPILSIITSIIFYSRLPEVVPSHWNYLGQVDGYSSRLSTLIGFPILEIVMVVLLLVIPKMDPLYKSIKTFEDGYHKLITSFLIFFLIIQYQVILWAMDIKISPNIVFPIFLGLLFYQVGNLLKVSKRNWTIGIRTPWTLASDNVWEKTHKIGATLFKLSLPIFLASLIFGQYTLFVVLGYILFAVIYVFVYSYIEYKKEIKD